MDYVTEQFNGMRIVPDRKLELPLNIIDQSKERYTSFNIYNGVLYRAKPKIGINAYSEEDISLIASNESKPFIIGAFGFSDNSFLCENKKGKTCEVDINDLKVVSELELGVIHSSHTVVYEDYSLLNYQDEISYSEPIKLGRKNNAENHFSWTFESENITTKRFSVTKDRTQVGIIESDGTITLLDALSGNVLWSRNVDNIGVLTPEELELKDKHGLGACSDNLHIYENSIICGYPYDYLISLDLQTGELLWKRKTNTEISWLTVTEQGFAYYVDNYFMRSGIPKLVIVDCITGENSKEFELEIDNEIKDLFGQSYSDVTTTHFWGVSSKGLLYAINLNTGKIDWNYHLGYGMPRIPFFICNNRLYIRTVTEDFIFQGKSGYIPD